MSIRSPLDCARESLGVSDDHLYQLAIRGLDVELAAAHAVLDLGCGVGNFGRFLRGRYRGRLDAADGVRFEALPAEVYDRFHQFEFNADFEPPAGMQYNLVFHLEVIHYLENPRALARKVARLLRPGGLFVFTTVNPLALPSVLVLLRTGVFRSFQEAPYRYPGQITPLVPEDGRRIVREAGLKLRSLDFSGRSRLPGSRRDFQHVLPFLGGRWFSDHYRVVAERPQG